MLKKTKIKIYVFITSYNQEIEMKQAVHFNWFSEKVVCKIHKKLPGMLWHLPGSFISNIN